MNFFRKLFGGKRAADCPDAVVEDTLQQLFEIGQFDLRSNVRAETERIIVEVEGSDSELLKERDGQLLDAFQFFIKRVVQHQFPETRLELEFDTQGFREESNQALIDLAEKLKNVAIEKGKSVYIRALAPKDRKVVHQYLAGDERIRSKSIGDGHFKKIKIFPSQNRRNNEEESSQSAEG